MQSKLFYGRRPEWDDSTFRYGHSFLSPLDSSPIISIRKSTIIRFCELNKINHNHYYDKYNGSFTIHVRNESFHIYVITHYQYIKNINIYQPIDIDEVPPDEYLDKIISQLVNEFESLQSVLDKQAILRAEREQKIELLQSQRKAPSPYGSKF